MERPPTTHQADAEATPVQDPSQILGEGEYRYLTFNFYLITIRRRPRFPY